MGNDKKNSKNIEKKKNYHSREQPMEYQRYTIGYFGILPLSFTLCLCMKNVIQTILIQLTNTVELISMSHPDFDE